MTREEALKHYKFLKEEWVEMDIEEYTEFIYDEFESRICENCKYSDFDSSIRAYACDKLGAIFAIEYNFGCNKFEKKTDD